MSFFNMFKKADEQQMQGGKQDGAKPDLDSTFFNMKVKQLPANFAQSVMDLEMKLEFAESCDIEAIQQLN